MTNEGGGGCMRDSPRSPTVKTNGSSREGNRIINPHSRIPKSTNKQTNKQVPLKLKLKLVLLNYIQRRQRPPILLYILILI